MKRKKPHRDTEPTPYRVTWTHIPHYWTSQGIRPNWPAAVLVYGSPTRSRGAHLRQIWQEWIDANPPTPLPENPRPKRNPVLNNPGYVLRQRKGETPREWEARKIARSLALLHDEHKRNKPRPDALPPHAFTRWTHPPGECGPVYPKSHTLESLNSPWAWTRTPETPPPAKPRRGRPTKSTLPPNTPPKLRSRWSYRIPAVLIPGCPPEVAHVPPLSLVCDPDPATGTTADAAALARWQAHASHHYTHAELETGTPPPPPRKRLPKGTRKVYAGAAGDPSAPLALATVPPCLPDPYPRATADAPQSPAPAPRSGKARGEILAAMVDPEPTRRRVNTEAPTYLAYEDEQRPRDRRTIEHREYVKRVADAMIAGTYDPDDPWKRTPAPPTRGGSANR